MSTTREINQLLGQTFDLVGVPKKLMHAHRKRKHVHERVNMADLSRSALRDSQVSLNRYPCFVQPAEKAQGMRKIGKAKAPWILTMREMSRLIGFRIAELYALLERGARRNEISKMKARHTLCKVSVHTKWIRTRLGVI